jgi:hypothetical protein
VPDRITLDPSTDLLDAEARTRARWSPGQMEAGPANETSRVLASGELHGDNQGRRATAPPTTSIPPSEKGEGGRSGPPPQRSTVQTRRPLRPALRPATLCRDAPSGLSGPGRWRQLFGAGVMP